MPQDVKQGPEGDVTQETVTFRDHESGNAVVYDNITDETYKTGMDDACALGDFLSRPVRIFSVDWPEGGSISSSLEPWDLFFNAAQIRRKLDNFGLLRCKLHVKVMINAAPFYYGLALISYHPLTDFNPPDAIAVASAVAKLVARSQHPHIWIYPQDSQGGEMDLPFFYHKNWIDATVRQNFKSMGTLHIDSLGALRNANSVTGSDVTIVVYAWATDVELAAPTTGLALQSSVQKVSRSRGMKNTQATTKKTGKDAKTIGKASGWMQGFKDEYGKGPVEVTSSAVASAAETLSEVPVIGPFMTATSVVASAASTVASYFGWSNPPMIENVPPRKGVPFHALASSEISTPVDKLTLDPKNELCVDSRTVGLDGTDELSVSNLVQRESFLTSFEWTTGRAPGDLLWGTSVHCNQVANDPGTVSVFGVPMAYLAQMFRYWHGDIIFRFQVICSQYHRGRVRISWDPLKDISGVSDCETMTYTETYDIAQENDFEVKIPWMQDTTWCSTGNDYTKEKYSAAGGPALELGVDNGKLSVRVLTQLTAPVATSDVTVAVSVRAAENFALANPRRISNVLTHFNLQSTVTPVAKHDLGNDVYDLGNTVDEIDASYLVFHGEAVKSIRQLMRRYTLYRTVSPQSNTSGRAVTFLSIQGRYPLAQGWDPNGINSAVGIAVPGNHPYNYVINTPMTWMAPCFVGQRGSVNWIVNPNSTEVLAHVSVTRLPQTGRSAADHHALSVKSNTDSENQAAGTIFALPTWKGLAGIALTHQRTQTGFSVQLPMYSRFRMHSTNPHSYALGSAFDETNVDSVAFAVSMKPAQSGLDTKTTYIDFYAAAGTDYTCFFFLQVPRIYVQVIPTPVP